MFAFSFSSKRTAGTCSSDASSGQTNLADTSLLSTPVNVPGRDLNSPISFPLSAHLLARSTSLPIRTPVAGPSRPKGLKHSSYQISSTQSLKLDPRLVYAPDDGYFGKQLSPISEKDYFSPERMPIPLPSEHTAEKPCSTPGGSEYSDAPRQSQTCSTFLKRPLKKSISQLSQASLRTHRSNGTAPPYIPPLDLSPAFFSNHDAPALLTPSRFTAVPLPPKPAATNRPLSEYPGESDASSLHAESFISARSAAQSIRNGLGERVNPDPYSQAEQGSIIRSSTTRSSQSTSSYLGRRWTTSLSFGSDLLLFSKSREKSQHGLTRMTPACMLFWLGFAAPWCWILGGWMLTECGETKAEGTSGSSVLPSWSSKKGLEKRIEGAKIKEKVAGGTPSMQGYGFAHGYPFVAPSVESLTPSGKMLRMKQTTGSKSLNPWVARCRVAGVASGILLLVAFVVAFVEVGKGR